MKYALLHDAVYWLEPPSGAFELDVTSGYLCHIEFPC